MHSSIEAQVRTVAWGCDGIHCPTITPREPHRQGRLAAVVRRNHKSVVSKYLDVTERQIRGNNHRAIVYKRGDSPPFASPHANETHIAVEARHGSRAMVFIRLWVLHAPAPLNRGVGVSSDEYGVAASSYCRGNTPRPPYPHPQQRRLFSASCNR